MEKRDIAWGLLIIFAINLVVITIIWSLINGSLGFSLISGDYSEIGTVNFVITGAAGMILSDSEINFGRGYYNGTCYLNYSVINSNTSKECWVNTSTYFLQEDVHVIENSGSNLLNITATLNELDDAEHFFCNTPKGCVSDDSLIRLRANESESNSCLAGINTNYQTMANNTNNFTIGLCDSLRFSDIEDTLKTYVEFQVPRDALPGNKSLVVNYEATSA